MLGLLCLCLCVIWPGQAQNTTSAVVPSPAATGKITGQLLDSLTGKPIEYATVALLPKGLVKAQDGTLTNAQGQFSFNNVPYGQYTLSFSFIGYDTKQSNLVEVSAQNPVVTAPTMRLATSSTKLKEVTVTSLRPTITYEADKMVVSVEGTALAAGRTAFDVLSRAPGVFVDPEGNIQLNGRGGITVMLNGKLTYMSAIDLRNMLESMSAENIKNIEIMTNPSAKFDAEGSSGILNINLKKNEIRGINGSVQAGVNTNFKQVGGNVGGSIYHRAGNWNSFLITDLPRRVNNREGVFTRVFDSKDGLVFIDQDTKGQSKNLGPPNFRVGTDYSLTDQHSVGTVISFNRNTAWSDFLSDSYYGTTAGQPSSLVDADNYTTNTFTNFNTNVHYTGKLDTVGTTLSADLDFVKIANYGASNFYNYTTYYTAGKAPEQDFLYTNTENGFNIYSAKVDYAQNLFGKSKLELGVKASRVESDNDSKFYFNNTGLVLDKNRTNHFIYDENIYAAYANWNSTLSPRYILQLGLRAEGTQSRGESLTTKQVTNREYLNFFPSFFLQQKLSENYHVNYSYTRRIQRPNYGNLNPFIIYRDPFTVTQGNPGLRPQFTHALSVTQRFFKDYSLVFNYQYMQDVMSELPILDVEKALTIYTTGNVDDSYNFSFVGIAPFQISKKWDTNNTLTVAYNEFRITALGERQINAQVLYAFQTTHNILLPSDFKLEINGTARGPGASGLYKVGAMWWVHLGLRKSFLNKKLDLTVNLNDVFRSYRLRFDTRIGNNVNDFDQYLYMQNLGFSLRYNFSRGAKFDPKKRNNNLEELNRT